MTATLLRASLDRFGMDFLGKAMAATTSDAKMRAGTASRTAKTSRRSEIKYAIIPDRFRSLVAFQVTDAQVCLASRSLGHWNRAASGHLRAPPVSELMCQSCDHSGVYRK